jgi:KipI family sensor histidine kinase inhibitor
MPDPMHFPRLLALGDSAWIVEFGAQVDAQTHAKVMGLARALTEGRDRGEWPGIVEWVPAGTTLTVHFDERGLGDAAAEAAPALLQLARSVRPLARPGRRWTLPVCFDADFGVDLDEVARLRGLTPPQVVQCMTGAVFRVYMLGFQPGFAYMGGLPAELELPRRATPRTAVPERSLAVAGRMCAVYPWRSPGGWHLLGRTPLALFDAARADDPAWLRAGDEVRWMAVDRERYEALRRHGAAGAMRRDEWLQGPEAVP